MPENTFQIVFLERGTPGHIVYRVRKTQFKNIGGKVGSVAWPQLANNAQLSAAIQTPDS
jgi:hypothetical protein